MRPTDTRLPATTFCPLPFFLFFLSLILVLRHQLLLLMTSSTSKASNNSHADARRVCLSPDRSLLCSDPQLPVLLVPFQGLSCFKARFSKVKSSSALLSQLLFEPSYSVGNMATAENSVEVPKN